jgi:flagellar biogenesis protein FliO
MKQYSTEDVTIGIIATIGVLILIVVFVWVVRQILSRKD